MNMKLFIKISGLSVEQTAQTLPVDVLSRRLTIRYGVGMKLRNTI